MRHEDTLRLLALLDAAGMRYTPVMDEATAGIWHQNLRDITADEGLEAVRRIIALEEDFPTIARVCDMARKVRKEARQRALPAQGASYRCKCQDIGMVEVEGQRDAWRPCERCNAEAFARWESGAYVTKVFRAVLDPIDAELAAEQLAEVREVLARAGQPTRAIPNYEEGAA